MAYSYKNKGEYHTQFNNSPDYQNRNNDGKEISCGRGLSLYKDFHNKLQLDIQGKFKDVKDIQFPKENIIERESDITSFANFTSGNVNIKHNPFKKKQKTNVKLYDIKLNLD